MTTSDPTRPRWRLRAIHRKMSFAAFQRTVPVRPGWKREYYGGTAHVRPSWTYVRFILVLAARPEGPVTGTRTPVAADAGPIRDAFLDSFRFAPEYADYPMAGFRKKAAEYVAGFFGDIRGTPSPASVIVEAGGRVLAAALVKDCEGKAPLLDCLFVRPEAFRRGLATAATAAAVNRLLAAGHTELRSGAMLANEPSIAWHRAFGFRECPDYFVAQARCFAASYERERLEELGILTAAEDERLSAVAEHWWDEVNRLSKLPFAECHAGPDD